MLISDIYRANVENLNDATISLSIICRHHLIHRSKINNEVKSEFLTVEKSPLVVHWDGKLMEDTANKENNKTKAERLPIAVTGYKMQKILEIPKLGSGKRKEIANEVFQILTK